MQTVYILVNEHGLLLGIYREIVTAKRAIKIYQKEESSGSPKLFLYEATSEQVNTIPSNKFKCIWQTNESYF